MNRLIALLRKAERSHHCGRMRVSRGFHKAWPSPETWAEMGSAMAEPGGLFA
jgi:hypothetical protein